VSVFNIGFVIFPQLTQLDFTGPLQVLARLPDAATHIVAKSTAPVPSDCGLSLVPTCPFGSCPTLDLICIPGGSVGVADVLRDRETIEFVRRQASGAKYVTSVCTRRLRARRGGTFARSPGDDSLGLHRSAPSGRCHPREISGGEGWQPDHRGRRHLRHRLRPQRRSRAGGRTRR